MISSIFEKTKPINFIIVFAFLFVFYWLAHFLLFDKRYSPEQFLAQLFILGVLLFSLFLVNFICHRNKITATNSFALLFYALLMFVFPETMTDSKAIFCSFFLLLGTRRVISLKSLKEVKLKIFDATLWILVASLFYNWAVLYMLLVLVAIYTYDSGNVRNWLVPLTSAFTVFIISYGIVLLLGKSHVLGQWYQFHFDFSTTYFFDWGNSIRLIIYVLITLAAGVLAFVRLGNTGLAKIVTMRLVAFSFFIGIVIKLFTTSDTTYPVILTFFPAVVFMANYVESLKKINIKEIVLILSIVLPFLVFVTSLVLK